jgi:translation initiation factor IF-2
MSKVRLYVLAKELDVAPGDLAEWLREDGNAAATASSSVDEDVAERLRRRARAMAANAAAAIAPKAAPAPVESKPAAPRPARPPAPRKPGPPEPAPLPPPRPIEKREKAVKPARRADLSADEKAQIEEKRRARLARLHGMPEGAGTTADMVQESGGVATSEAAEREAHGAPTWSAGEVAARDAAHAAEREPHAAGDATAPGAAAHAAVSMSQPTAAAATRAASSLAHAHAAPAAAPGPPPVTPPLRPIREFRGPIRKIELPPQPQRSPVSPYGRMSPPGMPARPGAPGLGPGVAQRPGAPGRPAGPGPRRVKRKGEQPAPPPAQIIAPVKKGEGRIIRLTEGVTVKELADKLEVKAKDIIQILLRRGVMVTVNVALDPEQAKSLAEEFGFKPEVVSFEKDLQLQEEEAVLESLDFEGQEEPRPPVVTVMGHVDHGKTSLLDAIRKTNVAAGEAGGITQSIGAYQVDVHGRKVTFIDTPGHEAFTTMRSRGAQVTDVVVLVVAASEGVMPQTVEAIHHAKAAEVPVIVAINKIDLPNAKPERVKTELMQHGIVAEQFGGDVVAHPVSATKGIGINELLELIVLTADMQGLKASPRRRAVGTVLEAGIDRGLGVVANVLVQDGTLRPGDALIAGAEWGKVRALLDDHGERLESAGPSTPVQVTGLQGVPKAGDKLQAVESEARAKEISEFRQHKRREAEIAKSGTRGTLQDLTRAIAEGEAKELSVVIKADVHGAIEVLSKTIADLSTSKVKTKIVHAGTGAITDSDVLLAAASKAIVIGFNVRPERSAAELAERERVVIRLHTVIYHLVEEMRGLMTGLLDVVREEDFLGRAEVRQTFKVSRIGTVAGCQVQDGKIVRSAEVRLVRDGVVVWTGRLASLKRFKDDVREVAAGLECGMGLEGYNDIKVGDAIEAFVVKEIRPTSLE